MSGSGLPPQGFRWVEPPVEGMGGAPRRHRWWWLAGVLVVVLVAGGAGVWVWQRRGLGGGSGGGQAGAPAEPVIGTPKDLLVSFPLDRAPVPAWQLTRADLGLPDRTTIGAALFAGNADRAYFLAYLVDKDCGDHCAPDRGWVYGVDTHTGRLPYPPIELPDFTIGAKCYSNGPSVAVCLGYRPKAAWVLDLDGGAVTFTGPTDLNQGLVAGDFPAVPAGNSLGEARLLVAVRDKGVYGVGPHAERTWFVPGDGVIYPQDHTDLPPMTLLKQGRRVFSVVDGHDVTPVAPPGVTLGAVSVYNGGFAYAYTDAADAHGVLFYDTAGALVARQPLTDRFEPMMELNPAVPIASDGASRWQIFTAAGRPLITIPADMSISESRAIGTKFYLQVGYSKWQQWDLLTGQAGPTCTFGLDDVAYVGSDGHTVISMVQAPVLTERATDMATCRTLWETRPDHHTNMWKVGTGLIEYDHQDNTVTGLRSPDG